MSIYFYDSVDPAMIPAEAQYVALYADGRYAVPHTYNVKRFMHRRWITVDAAGFHCGIADYEPRNPVYDNPGALRRWALGRLDHYHSVPVAYSDMTDLHSALTELRGLPRLHWVATRGHGDLTPVELADLIRSTVGLTIPVENLWGHQYENVNDAFDISHLFGHWYA